MVFPVRHSSVTTTLLHVGFTDEEEGGYKDIIFTLLRNSKQLPVNFATIYQTRFTDNIYFGFRFLDTMNRASYYSMDYLKKKNINLFTRPLKSNESKTWMKDFNTYLNKYRRPAKEIREDEVVNRLLEKRVLGKPLKPFKQIQIMDELNANNLFSSPQKKEWTSLLRYTKYDWVSVNADRDPSLINAVQLFEKDEDKFIDYYKDMELKIAEVLVARLLMTSEEHRKRKIRSTRNKYYYSAITEKPEFHYYFDRIYGSLDNFLKNDTLRDIGVLDDDLCFGLSDIRKDVIQ